MKKTLIIGGLVLLVSAFTLALSAGAAFVGTNGGFELGVNPGVFSTLAVGDSTSITDWNVGTGEVDYIGSYWQASDGERSVDLNGSAAGSISQTFATTAGATYAVNFYLSGNPDLGPSTKVVRVSATGAASQDFTYDTGVKGNSKADMKWEADTYTFVASGTSTTLTFASQTDGAAGPALDNVSINFENDGDHGKPNNNKDECKKDGWINFANPSFKNQGQCVSSVVSHHEDNDSDNEENENEESDKAEIHANANAHLNLNLNLKHGDDDENDD